MNSFAERFDSFYSAIQSRNSYLESKGYADNGFGQMGWEPAHEVEVEPEKLHGPGAMVRGELDDYTCCADCEEFYQDNDEADLYGEDFEPEEF